MMERLNEQEWWQTAIIWVNGARPKMSKCRRRGLGERNKWGRKKK